LRFAGAFFNEINPCSGERLFHRGCGKEFSRTCTVRYIALCSNILCNAWLRFFAVLYFYSEGASAWGVLGVNCGLRHVQHLRDPFFYSAPKRRAVERKRRGFFCVAKHWYTAKLPMLLAPGVLLIYQIIASSLSRCSTRAFASS